MAQLNCNILAQLPYNILAQLHYNILAQLHYNTPIILEPSQKLGFRVYSVLQFVQLQVVVTLFSDMTTYILIDRYQRFEGRFLLRLQGISVPFLNLEKVEIPPKCQTTRCHVPQQNTLHHCHCSEKLEFCTA